MEWIVENWKAVAIIGGALGVLALIGWGFVAATPDSHTIKSWSMQEAIFYGFCVLAVATWLSK